LSVLNGSFGGSSGSWNTVAGWIGNGPWPTATPESGFSGRANGPSKFEGIAAEARELTEQSASVVITKVRSYSPWDYIEVHQLP
jgi:hypothetical protein